MNDQDYIKAAVELADGIEWPVEKHATREFGPIDRAALVVGQKFLDALAAQLVRQVDATEKHTIRAYRQQTVIETIEVGALVAISTGYDRTMNTLKCIVDSGVLSG